MHVVPPPGRFHGHHAIVIGGSMAGLVAARVLSGHFDRVTVLDRDILPSTFENRRGVPQGRHGHGLLASGLRGLTELFPGFERELVAAGALPADVIGNIRWFQHGHYKAKFTSGLDGLLMSRPLVEVTLRRQVEQLSNVHIVDGSRVTSLLTHRDGVHGVRVRRVGEGEIPIVGDLVVDASGRSSRTPEWLAELGYAKPAVDEVSVGIGYTTRTFRRLPGHLDGDKGAIVAPTPPREMRMGFLLAMEADRWIVGLGGWLGNHAPTELEAFIEFARSLPRPDIYDVIRHAEPLTDAATFGFPSNLRRRYELLKRFPSNFLVIGDAFCSFNPIYGQGMSVATLTGLALRRCLEGGAPLAEIWKPFFAETAKITGTPWMIAAGSDFGFHGVTGPKPAGVDIVNWYLGHVHRAAATDPTVCRAFFEVAQLLTPSSVLFRPGILARVARECLFERAPVHDGSMDTKRRRMAENGLIRPT
jgi:flavin-dependent dehydrogenase